MVNYWDKYTEMHGQQNIKKKNALNLFDALAYLGTRCDATVQ